MRAMHSIAKVTGKAVATAFDLSRFKTACDLGGEETPLLCTDLLLGTKGFFLFMQDVLVPWPMSLLKSTQSCV